MSRVWHDTLVETVEDAWMATKPLHRGVPDKFGRLVQERQTSLDGDAFARFLALRISRYLWHIGGARQTSAGVGDHVRRQKRIPVAYVRLLEALKDVPLVGIVTTNYDIVLEKILGPIRQPGRLGGFHYGVDEDKLAGTHSTSSRHFFYGPSITGLTPLLKVHGSLNWALDDNGAFVKWVDCRPSRLLGYQPIVVPPGGSAQADALREVWRGSAEVLRRARTWIVCGYSVPEYDADVRELLIASTERLRHVIILDPKPAPVERKLRGVIGGTRGQVKYVHGGALSSTLQPSKLRALISAGS
jgi:hypothetical protein